MSLSSARYVFTVICIERGKSRGLGAVEFVGFPRVGEYFSRNETLPEFPNGPVGRVYRIIGVVHGTGEDHDMQSAGDLFVEYVGSEADLQRHVESGSFPEDVAARNYRAVAEALNRSDG